MHRYLISVFYKQQPDRPTLAQLLNPATLRSGDRYSRIFKGDLEFSNTSHQTLFDEVFATFNGHGQALPPIPRSMSVGDIIAVGENALAFLVTATGFEKLRFASHAETFEITPDLLWA
jgi:hypothetical protein